MKTPLLTGFIVACAAAVLAAQTPQTPTAPAGTMPSPANQTMTLVGCVGGGASATDPFMLSDVTVGSIGTSAPGQATSGVMPPMSSGTPTGTAGATGTAGTASTPTSTPTTGTVGTAGTGTAVGATGTVGTTGATGTAATGSATGATGAGATVGATGATAATPATPPAAGSAAVGSAAPVGYRLSGADVSGFRGQRVQMVGTFTPQSATAGTAAAPTAGAAATTPGTTPDAREFLVQSVHPIAGNCPPR